MNNAHLHVAVNHLPIVFPVVGVIILLIGIFTKSDVSKRNASYYNFLLDKVMPVTILIVAGLSLYFAQEAGRTGGEIRHTEIRSVAAIQNAGEQSGESDDD